MRVLPFVRRLKQAALPFVPPLRPDPPAPAQKVVLPTKKAA